MWPGIRNGGDRWRVGQRAPADRRGGTVNLAAASYGLRLDELDSKIATLRSTQASVSQRDQRSARALGEACVLLEAERLAVLWELLT